MKNIDSIIDKACVEYCEQVNSVYNEKDVFKAGANFILHQNRWRKVEEEMPEVRDKPYKIVGRSPNHLHYEVISISKEGTHPIDLLKFFGVIEWKPIE